MDDLQPRMILDGDVSPLRQKFREASAELKRFGAEGESALGRMTGPLGALQQKFVAVGAILAGGAVFKAAVEQAANFTEESMKLGTALGTSATEASTFITTLEDIDVSQEQFIAATKAMSKELLNNESSLQSMGLKTRDAAGNLRPLNQLTVEGIEIVKGYKAGTDRAIAGQTMFGKSFELTGNLLKLNSESLAENAALQQKLGIIVGAENVEAWEAYDSATDQANLTVKAMYTTIGNALMPVLTTLSEWFVAIGPAAVVVFKGVIGGLVSLFWGLKSSAEIVWNTIALAIEKTTIQALRFGDVAIKAVQLDFDGAKAAWERGGEMIQEVTDKRFANIIASAESTQKKLWELFAEGTPAASSSTDGKSAAGLLKEDPKKPTRNRAAKDPVDPSNMATYDARLAAIKNLYEQENTLREFSKAQELAYWRDVQQNLVLTNKDAVTIAKRTAALELDIRRDAARQTRELDSVMLDSKRAAALAQIDQEEQQATFARENGEITKLQLLEQEEQFARRRFEIEYQSLLERQELAKNDPATSPAALTQIKEQMLQIERQYQLQKGTIGQSKKKEQNSFGNIFDDSEQAFGNMAKNMLTSATTLRQQLGTLFTSIGSSIIDNLAIKPLAEWIASKAKMLAISLGFMAEEAAVETTSATAQAMAQQAIGVAGVTSNSAIAATAAMASVAAIPFYGWAMAPGVGASTYALGMGYLASAQGGFDIPRGLNPMTQLHEEEMVLPKIHANTIRKLGESGGDASAGRSVANHITVTAMDARDVQRALKQGGALHKALKDMDRLFVSKR